ncbi:MAG TPA: serine kinase [Clostridia bacterium]|jgi:serine kinase of HPr protein (carbohydrate metabolism regulator)|nr:serine kinase [Clostridia bacterium]
MKVQDLIKPLNLIVWSGRDNLNRIVTGGYCSDLLSDVMANAYKGSVWVTVQNHQNIVAVASLLDLSAIILANKITPDKETSLKAEQEGIPILCSSLPTFELVGRMYRYGIYGIKS